MSGYCNKIVVGLLGVAACAAQAQNTARAWQFRMDMCKAVAIQADFAYRKRLEGRAHSMEPFRDMPARVLVEWAVQYATKNAISREDAFKVSFAMCLDNVDRVFGEHRIGRETKIEDLR